MKKSVSADQDQPTSPELEDFIFDWIVVQRTQRYVAMRAAVKQLAMAMEPHFDISSDKFKATNSDTSSGIKKTTIHGYVISSKDITCRYEDLLHFLSRRTKKLLKKLLNCIPTVQIDLAIRPQTL